MSTGGVGKAVGQPAEGDCCQAKLVLGRTNANCCGWGANSGSGFPERFPRHKGKRLGGERDVVLFPVLMISQQIKVEGVEPHGIQFAFLAFVTPPARMSSFEFLLVGTFPSTYR